VAFIRIAARAAALHMSHVNDIKPVE